MSAVRVMLTIVSLLAAMGLCAVWGLRERVAALVLAVLSFLWLIVDHFFEGRVLVSFDAHHGLTSADLVGLAGFLVAAAEWVIVTRRR